MRTGLRTAAAIAAVALPTAMAGTAFANPPGDNGDVKIHRVGAPEPEQDNQPHVCKFYLDAFNFDTLQKVHWEIDTQAPTKPVDTKAADGDIVLKDGNGATTPITLPDGHYKLFWNFEGEHGAAKQKVFWVDCGAPATSPSSSSSSSSSSPTKPSGSHSSSSPSSPASSSVSATGATTGGTPGGTGGTTGGTGGGTGGSTGGSPTSPAPSGSPTTSSSTGSLAHTGVDGSVLYIAAGAIALGGGGFALRRYAIARGKA
ncbi:MAG: LPXTG cell wall anchor domain-containing protein [Catenulispora sp.]|nr:LPXTG cell wall anchor domain-containing protein [Catenulispora sp.]